MIESIFTICAANKVYKNHLGNVKPTDNADELELVETVDVMEKELATILRGHLIRSNDANDINVDEIDVYEYMCQAIHGILSPEFLAATCPFPTTNPQAMFLSRFSIWDTMHAIYTGYITKNIATIYDNYIRCLEPCRLVKEDASKKIPKDIRKPTAKKSNDPNINKDNLKDKLPKDDYNNNIDKKKYDNMKNTDKKAKKKIVETTEIHKPHDKIRFIKYEPDEENVLYFIDIDTFLSRVYCRPDGTAYHFLGVVNTAASVCGDIEYNNEFPPCCLDKLCYLCEVENPHILHVLTLADLAKDFVTTPCTRVIDAETHDILRSNINILKDRFYSDLNCEENRRIMKRFHCQWASHRSHLIIDESQFIEYVLATMDATDDPLIDTAVDFWSHIHPATKNVFLVCLNEIIECYKEKFDPQSDEVTNEMVIYKALVSFYNRVKGE